MRKVGDMGKAPTSFQMAIILLESMSMARDTEREAILGQMAIGLKENMKKTRNMAMEV